ncbi:hypothetical protein ACFZCL_34880 [Streptomyces sp. NPDC008159]|uniref:hypothetical protein n=1 Tax=Streptomyces sp. NPDC008159 TaxID=3364817 RepID=UPI0036E13301
MTALRDEVQKVLDGATESDNSASRVLKALVDQTELGFSDASYKNRDSVADALKRADDLAKLAKKNPEDLTAREFEIGGQVMSNQVAQSALGVGPADKKTSDGLYIYSSTGEGGGPDGWGERAGPRTAARRAVAQSADSQLAEEDSAPCPSQLQDRVAQRVP